MRSSYRTVMEFRAFAAVALAAICLAATGASAGASETLRAPGLPLVEAIGCRLNGLNVVCDRSGKILPNRDKKLRKKGPAQAPQAAPAESKQKSKSTTSKSQGATSKSSKSQSSTPSSAPQEDEAEEPAAMEATEAAEESTEGSGADAESVAHSCPPGNVVLEKPNAAGSYCEPVKTEAPKATEQKPTSAPHDSTIEPSPQVPAETKTETSSPPATEPNVQTNGTTPPSTETPAKTVAPQSGDKPSTETQAAKQICCKQDAFGKSNGRPYSPDGLSMCGATELDAKKLLKSFADAGNYRLSGPVACQSK